MQTDAVLALLPLSYTQEQYDQIVHLLGFDQPLIIQYLRYISDLFTGKWGSSTYGQPVLGLISERFPRMIDLLLLPTILGLGLGILFRVISIKFRKKWIDHLIQAPTAIGIATPIFSFGMVLQILFAFRWELLPVMGYKTAGLGDPPAITNFRILDCIIAGEWVLLMDYILHLVLPVLALSIVIIALITIQVRSNIKKDPREASIISNTMMTGITFGLILTFYVLIEFTFNFDGISQLFISAMVRNDIIMLRAALFTIVVFFVVITFISNIIFSILKSLTVHQQNSPEITSSPKQKDKNDQIKIYKIDSKRDLRKYLRYIYKSPFTLLGLIVVVGIIIVSLFPELISGYSLAEANGIYPGAYTPPSPGHLLGQTRNGRDVFARILFGTRGALIFGFGAALIGIIGGIIFGLISSLHRYVSIAIEGILIIFYIIPVVFLLLLITSILDRAFIFLMFTLGMLLIPIFTRIITNVPLNKRNILTSLKKLLIYIPLIIGIVIIIYEAIGFVISLENDLIQLGNDVSQARVHMYDAFHAAYWPGLFIFFLGIGFVLLHMGLKNTFSKGY